MGKLNQNKKIKVCPLHISPRRIRHYIGFRFKSEVV